MSRFNSFANIINAGGYKLAEMKERIRGLADRGELTLEERDKLLGMAETHADPLNETDKGNMLADHERRIKALEEKIAELMNQSGDTEDGESGVVTLKKPYDPSTWYFTGDGCSENGKNYTCKDSPASHPCTWPPSVLPARWELDEKQPEAIA